MRRPWILVALVAVIGVTVAIVAIASGGGGSDPSRVPQATRAELVAAGLGKVRVAPASRRVDLETPSFSHPTRVTNPLFPISNLPSAVLTGRVEGKPFRTETTVLPYTDVVEWPDGKRVATLVSQYVAYLDGRLEEVALDRYAQADDGSVWYFGEDVFNYKNGVIADTEGTWIAGKDGPAAMIMPAHPHVGDVYRSENVPGTVFEEVTVKDVGRTVKGPHGPVAGAMIGRELHDDGTTEDKTFAPEYGEFFTGGGGDVEAMAIAVPADKRPGGPPAELMALRTAASEAFDRPESGAAARRVSRAWTALRASGQPPRLVPQTDRAVRALMRAVASHDRTGARLGAIAVGQAALDLELRDSRPTDIDRARFDLWTRQLGVDASAGDKAGTAGDLATLEWIHDRIAHALDKVQLSRIDGILLELRGNVTDGDLQAAAEQAARLRAALAG